MTAPEKIAKLVESFKANYDEYMSGAFNETQTRVSFINPLFEALGWDVRNEEGRAETYREVVHEESIEVGRGLKAPDMTFRIGGIRKFFVECKKPSVDLKEETHPAYQLRRYGWSAKLPLSILTDFEEFAVYDCRIKPRKSDKASVALIKYYKFEDYINQWDEIAALFSREAVLTGAFDRYAVKVRKRGTAEVDDAFLEEIERWREKLAKSVALRNRGLTDRELNYTVQQTIDRIIFLRICEDRGIEPYQALAAVSNGANIYDRLKQLFVKADQRFNSGLFHFNSERGRNASPDELTPRIKIDDEVLKEIIASLYYPNPYEFSVFPADILGQVYERFLGKVIRLTAGHQAKVEEKPEVRKAGGVYYTPTYIVDYIVKNTVGKLLEGKTPKKVEKLRILDPACGSGSFLIGAYQHLLDWHLKWYLDDGPAKHKKTMYQVKKNEWRLTTAERKRILLNNIYGVDIDSQAVEVTKLSLLLKVLEGENKQTLDKQMKLFHERALPDLESNIKCGNSLIGPEELNRRQIGLFGDEDQRRINSFNWAAEYPDIFESGGFDVVIGNPPYIRIQAMKEWAPVEVELYKEQYKTAEAGNYDIYVVFVEKGLHLLNKKGRMGFILPHKFFNAQYGEGLRGIIADGKHLAHVVHFGDQQVFAGATTYTCLMFLNKACSDKCHFVRVDDLMNWINTENAPSGWISSKNLTNKEWDMSVGGSRDLMERLRKYPLKLEGVTNRIFQGIKTGADKIYIVDEKERKAAKVKVFSRERDKEYWLEHGLLHPLIKGGDSKRYSLTRTKRLILFPYQNATLIDERTLKKHYPLAWKYLLDNRQYLEEREHGKMQGDGWYGYSRNQALDVMPLSKIFTPDIAAHASFSLDKAGDIFFTGGAAGGYGILVKSEYAREYILGLLNSKLLEWFIRQSSTRMRGGYFSFESRFIKHLPIRAIDFKMRTDKSRHDNMVALTEQMLELNKRLGVTNTPHEQTALKRQIASTDHRIDQLVYELYGLTKEEIGIVEAACGGQ